EAREAGDDRRGRDADAEPDEEKRSDGNERDAVDRDDEVVERSFGTRHGDEQRGQGDAEDAPRDQADRRLDEGELEVEPDRRRKTKDRRCDRGRRGYDRKAGGDDPLG